MKKTSIEILKQTHEAYKLAQSKRNEVENTLQFDKTQFNSKMEKEKNYVEAQLNVQLDEIRKKYQVKLDEISTKKATDYYVLFADRDNELQKLRYSERKTADRFNNAVENFISQNEISNEQMLAMLQKETGKKWMIVKNAYSGVMGSDRDLGKYIDLGIDLFLVNSDNPSFGEKLTKKAQKSQGSFLLLDVYRSTFPYRDDVKSDMEKEVKNTNIDWIRLYLTQTGFLNYYYSGECSQLVAGEEIKKLIVQAIDNQYFNANEEEKAQD